MGSSIRCNGCLYYKKISLMKGSKKCCHYCIETGNLKKISSSDCYRHIGTPYKSKWSSKDLKTIGKTLEEYMITFTDNFKRILMLSKYTQNSFAEKTGIRKNHIMQLYRGESQPTYDDVLILVDTLGCTINEITGLPSLKWNDGDPNENGYYLIKLADSDKPILIKYIDSQYYDINNNKEIKKPLKWTTIPNM